ncbi:hypothetical protein DMUE_2736 [Dictyocoela muelleri]|nr:hypothetical protein DMUE_2736 [Dictyocoela muelleri]
MNHIIVDCWFQSLKKRKKKYSLFSKTKIYILFDETTDANGKYILNIMSGLCNKNKREKTYLVRTVELSRTNNEIISQEIINLMSELYDGKIAFEKLCLLLSDGAPYAVKAARNMKIFFPNLKHVTCIAHMLLRVCEKLRDISLKSNFIITKMKRILVKNH